MFGYHCNVSQIATGLRCKHGLTGRGHSGRWHGSYIFGCQMGWGDQRRRQSRIRILGRSGPTHMKIHSAAWKQRLSPTLSRSTAHAEVVSLLQLATDPQQSKNSSSAAPSQHPWIGAAVAPAGGRTSRKDAVKGQEFRVLINLFRDCCFC